MAVRQSHEEIEQRVIEVLVTFNVDRDALTPDASLEALDIDSLDVVELAETLREMGIDIEGRDFVDARTFGDAMRVIRERADAS
jgi:acyl carrier protein